jgi:outer membrane beta-barrel protein
MKTMLLVLFAATQAQAGEPMLLAATETDAEKVNVDTIKERYWARGESSELGVVQNRLYSKERKFELGTFGGVISTDPFLSVKNTGATLGYHFSEYLALHAVGWKSFVGPSTALTTFEQTIQATTNFNAPRSFFGLEGMASILYGKLSLVGKSIIYYDFHFTAGMGATWTESGTYATPNFGVGQQIYLSKAASLRVDYRLMHYREKIIEKVITPKLGQVVGERANWSNVVTVGVDFLVGFGE